MQGAEGLSWPTEAAPGEKGPMHSSSQPLLGPGSQGPCIHIGAVTIPELAPRAEASQALGIHRSR